MANVLLKNEQTGLCSGCGTCTVVCPTNYLKMSENTVGELRPVSVEESKCINCEKCLNICPFRNEIYKATQRIGKSYIGWSVKNRDSSASGGACTWFLNKLLEKKIVDKVVSVKFSGKKDEIFKYVISSSEEELIKCSGSSYYPVSLEAVLKILLKEEGKIAIVGVPCFISAIQNLRKSNKMWNEKIKVVVGLVCGHTPTKRLTDTLIWSSGHKRENIVDCNFRFKDEKHPAWDYGVKILFDDGTIYKSFGSSDYGLLFWRKLFSQKCCNYCSDTYAEQADITFMDAWILPYKENTNGTSMIINRNNNLTSVLELLEQDGHIEEISYEKALEAQKKLVLYKKNAGLHKKEEKLRLECQKLCNIYVENTSIINAIKHMLYKEKIKKQNLVLWFIITIKDKVLKK